MSFRLCCFSVLVTVLATGAGASTLPDRAAAEAAALNFLDWTRQGSPANGTWTVSSFGVQAAQSVNGLPSVFLNPIGGIAANFTLEARVGNDNDDDFFGFVIGFQPGDLFSNEPGAVNNTDGDYLLVDWKRGTQDGAFAGLRLGRVSGSPSSDEFWTHTDTTPGDGSGIEQLARGSGRGSIGWLRDVEYQFNFSYAFDALNPSATRLGLEVCRVTGTNASGASTTDQCLTEFDHLLDQPVFGNIGLYTYSQSQVTFGFDGADLTPVFYGNPDPLQSVPNWAYAPIAGTAVAPAPVPLPAALWMLAGAVGGLAGLGRWRRAPRG